MGLKKGQTNNKEGRPTGSKNKKTKEWEQLGEFITNEGAKRVIKYLHSIKDDKEFFDKYTLLINYFKPKMQSTQLDANVKKPTIIEFRNVSKQFPDK